MAGTACSPSALTAAAKTAPDPVHRGFERRMTDGAITVEVSSTVPANATQNWLPAPWGPYFIAFRAYRPRTQDAERYGVSLPVPAR